jgi:DNA-binding NarL/FixJ family response regulator
MAEVEASTSNPTVGGLSHRELALAVVAGELGQPKRAARLLGAAAALQEAGGRAVSPLDLAERERQVASVREVLGDERFAEVWADGQAMSLERALEYALTAPPFEGTLSVTSARSTREELASPLSAREQEVAVLLARGLSNRQIADELVISSRTAGTHLTHILNKLGLANRAQIAAWAVEHDLVAR